MNAMHTPTPWETVELNPESWHIWPNNGKDTFRIATCYCHQLGGEDAKANAAFIVRAVNAHDDLVAALRKLIGDFESEIHNEYDGTSMLEDRLAEIDYARAALAKAGA